MTKALEELAHKFPQLDTAQLESEAAKLDGRIKAIQRSKDHHKHRESLSLLQSTLHRMKMELKRREGDAKRARWNFAITPTASA